MEYSYRFMRFPSGKPKSVTFSYDDCTKFDKPFVEILNKYGIKCTFNIPSTWIEEPSEDAKHLTAKVYNPTLKEIWFEINKKIYSVKSGEILDLE